VGPKIERLAIRIGVSQLLAARVVYGTRNMSMVFWGLHGLPYGRFAAVDLSGCLVWSSVFGWVGYLLSGSAEALVGQVRRIELFLLGMVLLAGVVVFLVNRLVRHELQPEKKDLAP
jgi:membrane protein DedA with SNARE-associated domain